jgi:outer membrane lipoprotein carrier protein
VKKFSFVALVWVLMVGLFGAAQAENGKDEAAIAELRILLQEAESLRGRFDQRLYDREGNLLQPSQGEFVLKRPGYFYWETLPPYEQVVVGNPKKLWVYDPDLEQVTVHKQSESQQTSPAQLLSGDLEALGEQYDVTREKSGDETRFILKSKTDDAMFARLTLAYQEGVLKELQFEDNMGQVTQLSFYDVELNPQVDDSLFQFDVPKGVDVIVND